MLVRVDEIANSCGLTNDQMIEYLENNGIQIDDFFANIGNKEYSEIIERFMPKKDLDEHKNTTSLKSIEINGLFGKYDYKFNFDSDICIWVSENGVGKTTILNIIVAVLTGDRKTLEDIDFEQIRVITKNDIYNIVKNDFDNQNDFMERIDYICFRLSNYVPRIYTLTLSRNIRMNSPINGQINKIIDYLDAHNLSIEVREEMHSLIVELKKILYNDNSEILFRIKNDICDECLFYPTYRRIEISLNKVFRNDEIYNSKDLIQYIGFGMRDVKVRISALLDKMRIDANNLYVKMHGEILNDLSLGKDIRKLVNEIPQIDQHKLEVVIKRIGEDKFENSKGLFKILNENINDINEIFYKYYLSKLIKIYDTQKVIDEKLTKFAEVCNKYLSGKTVRYNETLLLMHVYNEDNKIIEWEDLSSGEKQIVSIFSKVYLDIATSAILVIDEPEISLTIEWQKNFLVDIYNSGKVGLLISTTHSPFIFKNDFREYTNEIELYRS